MYCLQGFAADYAHFVVRTVRCFASGMLHNDVSPNNVRLIVGYFVQREREISTIRYANGDGHVLHACPIVHRMCLFFFFTWRTMCALPCRLHGPVPRERTPESRQSPLRAGPKHRSCRRMFRCANSPSYLCGTCAFCVAVAESSGI